jgi:bifunctional DNA-binding transcriptional regulator/antitoxin component of YhaV-PrlF toxin-antitoxin module
MPHYTIIFFGDHREMEAENCSCFSESNLIYCNCSISALADMHTKERPMELTIQVRERGVVTLPAELREKYNIENGKIFHLVDLEGIFVFVPMVPMVPELANEIERIRLEAGLSVDELLDDLRKQREQYNKEKYGKQPA